MLSSSDLLAVAIRRHASDELKLFKPACAHGPGVADLVKACEWFWRGGEGFPPWNLPSCGVRGLGGIDSGGGGAYALRHRRRQRGCPRRNLKSVRIRVVIVRRRRAGSSRSVLQGFRE